MLSLTFKLKFYLKNFIKKTKKRTQSFIIRKQVVKQAKLYYFEKLNFIMFNFIHSMLE